MEGKKSSIIFLRHNGMENEKDVEEVWPEIEKFGHWEKIKILKCREKKEPTTE